MNVRQGYEQPWSGHQRPQLTTELWEEANARLLAGLLATAFVLVPEHCQQFLDLMERGLLLRVEGC